MSLTRIRIACGLVALMVAWPAAAQTANPLQPRSGTANPLNPPRTQAAPAPQQAEPQQAEETKPRRQRRAKAEDGADANKPKREMSPAQKRNVEIMRACGAEWRSKKDELKPKGETWRSYLAKCRKQQAA